MGIVFSHGIWLDGQVMGKVCLGCISETISLRKLRFGRDIGWGGGGGVGGGGVCVQHYAVTLI